MAALALSGSAPAQTVSLPAAGDAGKTGAQSEFPALLEGLVGADDAPAKPAPAPAHDGDSAAVHPAGKHAGTKLPGLDRSYVRTRVAGQQTAASPADAAAAQASGVAQTRPTVLTALPSTAPEEEPAEKPQEIQTGKDEAAKVPEVLVAQSGSGAQVSVEPPVAAPGGESGGASSVSSRLTRTTSPPVLIAGKQTGAAHHAPRASRSKDATSAPARKGVAGELDAPQVESEAAGSAEAVAKDAVPQTKAPTAGELQAVVPQAMAPQAGLRQNSVPRLATSAVEESAGPVRRAGEAVSLVASLKNNGASTEVVAEPVLPERAPGRNAPAAKATTPGAGSAVRRTGGPAPASVPVPAPVAGEPEAEAIRELSEVLGETGREEASPKGTEPAPAVPQEKVPPEVSAAKDPPVARRAARSAVEEILPFRPPVTQAPATNSVSPADGEPSSPSVPARFDEWLKSQSGGSSAQDPERAQAAREAAPVRGAAQEAGGTKVRSVSVSTPDRGEVVFEAHIQPDAAPAEVVAATAPAATASASEAKPAPMPAIPHALAVNQDAPPMTMEAPEKGEEIPEKSEDIGSPAVGRDRKAAAEGRGRAESSAAAKLDVSEAVPAVKAAGQGPQTASQAGMQSSGSRPEAGPAPAPDPTPERAAETVKTATKPDTPAAPPREIKLEVTGGEQRVEVRLSERAGEVRVAVRTSDSHLAGELRENLPALTGKLSENGLRSEIWRPAASQSGEWRHSTETQAGNLSQEGDQQSRGQGGNARDDAEQRQAAAQEQKTHKQKGSDFAWLMSTLR